MPNVTKNFSWSELNPNNFPLNREIEDNLRELAYYLQIIRDYVGVPIIITSGYRSVQYNASIIGAVTGSQHTKGKAADFKISGYTPDQMYDAVVHLIRIGSIPEGGVGIYDNRLHYDYRGTKARWDNRIKKKIVAISPLMIVIGFYLFKRLLK